MLVQEAIASENIHEVGFFYVNEKATDLIPGGMQFPVAVQNAMASNGIVHYFNEKINMKISNQTQSIQFKRWFGDWQNDPKHASKAVNRDGTPKILYHYTNADFTVFDLNRSGSNQGQTHGDGIYLSSNPTEFAYTEDRGRFPVFGRQDKEPSPVLTVIGNQAQGLKFSIGNKVENDIDPAYNGYVTHSGEKLKYTDPSLYPDNEREWSVFARGFANKTTGMQKGEMRNFSVYTANYRYIINADGYMQGMILSKISLNNNASVEELYNEVYEETNTLDGLSEGSKNRQGHSNRNNYLSERQSDRNSLELDQFIKSHPEFYRDKSESGRNSNRRSEKGNESEVKTASMTEYRINKLIDMYGAGKRTDYARGWITSISPTDFINLTTKELTDRSKFDITKTEYGTDMNSYDYLQELKEDKLRTPYLAVDINTGEVVGHEGRHRMRALEREGITSTPVVIEFRDEDGHVVKEMNGYGNPLKTIATKNLINQFGSGYTATVDNVIPLNQANRDEIISAYGNENADIKFSSQNETATDARSLLSNALMTVAQNDIEKQRLSEYQAKIEAMNAEQAKLSELRSQIKELSFAKGKRDTAKIRELRDEAVKTANRVNIYDRQLLRLEASTPLKQVLKTETERVAGKTAAKVREVKG